MGDKKIKRPEGGWVGDPAVVVATFPVKITEQIMDTAAIKPIRANWKELEKLEVAKKTKVRKVGK